jgi:hypothetical protein
MLLLTFPIGYFVRSSQRTALLATTALAVVLLIPQTIWVNADNPDDINASYWMIQLISLAVGLGLTLLGRRLARTRGSASVC